MKVSQTEEQCEMFYEYLKETADIEKRVKVNNGYGHKECEWEAFEYGWNAAIKHYGIKHPELEPERKLLGYIEREEGFYHLYESEPGSIVTQAFILCRYCNGTISPCMGPKYDAVCLTCYDKERMNR